MRYPSWRLTTKISLLLVVSCLCSQAFSNDEFPDNIDTSLLAENSVVFVSLDKREGLYHGDNSTMGISKIDLSSDSSLFCMINNEPQLQGFTVFMENGNSILVHAPEKNSQFQLERWYSDTSDEDYEVSPQLTLNPEWKKAFCPFEVGRMIIHEFEPSPECSSHVQSLAMDFSVYCGGSTKSQGNPLHGFIRWKSEYPINVNDLVDGWQNQYAATGFPLDKVVSQSSSPEEDNSMYRHDHRNARASLYSLPGDFVGQGRGFIPIQMVEQVGRNEFRLQESIYFTPWTVRLDFLDYAGNLELEIGKWYNISKLLTVEVEDSMYHCHRLSPFSKIIFREYQGSTHERISQLAVDFVQICECSQAEYEDKDFPMNSTIEKSMGLVPLMGSIRIQSSIPLAAEDMANEWVKRNPQQKHMASPSFCFEEEDDYDLLSFGWDRHAAFAWDLLIFALWGFVVGCCSCRFRYDVEASGDQTHQRYHHCPELFLVLTSGILVLLYDRYMGCVAVLFGYCVYVHCCVPSKRRRRRRRHQRHSSRHSDRFMEEEGDDDDGIIADEIEMVDNPSGFRRQEMPE